MKFNIAPTIGKLVNINFHLLLKRLIKELLRFLKYVINSTLINACINYVYERLP
jgi:hypothetical protein